MPIAVHKCTRILHLETSVSSPQMQIVSTCCANHRSWLRAHHHGSDPCILVQPQYSKSVYCTYCHLTICRLRRRPPLHGGMSLAATPCQLMKPRLTCIEQHQASCSRQVMSTMKLATMPNQATGRMRCACSGLVPSLACIQQALCAWVTGWPTFGC